MMRLCSNTIIHPHWQAVCLTDLAQMLVINPDMVIDLPLFPRSSPN